MHQEPRIDFGERKDFVHAHALAEGVAYIPNTVGTRFAEFFLEHFAVLGFFVQAVYANLQASQGFLEGLLEGATNRHHFAHGLHLGGQTAISRREFLERETWNLGDHVVDARLKTRGRCTTGNLVTQLVQGIANCQLGGDFGNRKARRLRRQRRRTRDARVHFDHDHATVLGIDRELHVRAACVDTYFTQHRQRGIAHDLVFLVGQRLGWSNSDGVAGMHAHRVQVFDRADDDAVVGLIAHDFHLELFPAKQRFFDQQLVRRRGF